MPKFKPVSSLLTASGSNLESLLERAHYLQYLTRILREKIDPLLSDHITVANLRGDIAIVTADSPAWLNKIRYLAPMILQILKQEPGLEHLNNLHLKVQPVDGSFTPTHTDRQASLSTSSAKAIESAASGISDPELAEALRRLSRKGNPQTD